MRLRIRTLKPEIWADEKVGSLSLHARLLFVGLITMADDQGRLQDLPPAILGHVFPHDDLSLTRVVRCVDEIVQTGMLVRYEVGGRRYLAFRHWADHQKVNRAVDSRFPQPPVSDPSVKAHGSVSDKSRRAHSPARRRAVPRSLDPDPVVKRLCHRLAERIRANDPKADPQPESAAWVREMRLLVQKRDEAEVERVIDWCQADEFWQSNVLSPGKLRKQFTQLVLKAKSVNSRPDPWGMNITPERQAAQEAFLEAQERAREHAA